MKKTVQTKYDRFNKKRFLLIIKIFVTLITLISLIFLTGFIYEQKNLKKPANFGFSYSPRTTEGLGLDPKQTYLNSLSDLDPKTVRLMAYWDEIEKTKDQYNFSDLDYYLKTSKDKNVPVILAVGLKLPRWPECFTPEYLKGKGVEELRERQLKMVEKVVERYSQDQNIKAFQIENEPLLDFGICPKIDREFLIKEVELVRRLTKKDIILTDSGELRGWRTPMQLSDTFGTTVYKGVANALFGKFRYPFPAWTYSLKAYLVKNIFASNNKQIIISELQAEPWLDKPADQVPVEDQTKIFTPKALKENALFAKKTGFSESLFWGVEWWYYMKENGKSEYVETAREIFNN